MLSFAGNDTFLTGLAASGYYSDARFEQVCACVAKNAPVRAALTAGRKYIDSLIVDAGLQTETRTGT